jgi:serine/threonine protein kinase
MSDLKDGKSKFTLAILDSKQFEKDSKSIKGPHGIVTIAKWIQNDGDMKTTQKVAEKKIHYKYPRTNDLMMHQKENEKDNTDIILDEINEIKEKLKQCDGDIPKLLNSFRKRNFFLRVITSYASLTHRNLIELHGVFSDTNYVYIITECGETNFRDLIKKEKNNPSAKDGSFWLNVIMQIAYGLKHLHDNGLLFRNVNDRNVLIREDMSVFLSDYGFEKNTNQDEEYVESEKEIDVSDIRWSSPETLCDNTKTKATDIYGLSMFMYEVLTKNIPFHNLNRDEYVLFRAYKGERPNIPDESGLEWQFREEFIKLMKRCWNQTDTDRPDIDEVIKQLESMKTKIVKE